MLRCVRGRPDEKRIAISQPAGKKMELLHSNLPATHFVTIPDAFADNRGADANFLVRHPINMSHRDAETWVNLPNSSHPNERNVNKMAALVKMMTLPGETVMDPFCGSGAIGLASVMLGRNYIGLELMEDRANDAKGRFQSLGIESLDP